MSKPFRVGIIGFGHVGQYLFEELKNIPDAEVAFVWNKTRSAMEGRVPEHLILDSLDDIRSREPDLVVEVAHPSITTKHAADILKFADYLVCSPTALSDEKLEVRLRRASTSHSLYIPSGALWGAEDIAKMSDLGKLERLLVTMEFHPDSLKLNSPLSEKNETIKERTVLYQGPVRDLCPLAPNNVNTMAAAALAAHNLGMSKVEACLVSDPTHTDFHVVRVEVWGKPDPLTGHVFNTETMRKNPAIKGHVTGTATLPAFLSSVLRARGRPPGVHFC